MSNEAIKQRKLLVKKLKERGVSVSNPLFEHGMKLDRLCGAPTGNNSHRNSCNRRAKFQSLARGHKATSPSSQQTKVIIKLLPVTLSIEELGRASGMFKGIGGTKNTDHSNGLASQFERTHKKECRKTSTWLQGYYNKYGKKKENSKMPLDGQSS